MKAVINVLMFVFCIATSLPALSQCAMCKATVIANKHEKEKAKVKAEGLNTGILYLMVVPYIVFGVIGYQWYRHSTKERKQREQLAKALQKFGIEPKI